MIGKALIFSFFAGILIAPMSADAQETREEKLAEIVKGFPDFLRPMTKAETVNCLSTSHEALKTAFSIGNKEAMAGIEVSISLWEEALRQKHNVVGDFKTLAERSEINMKMAEEGAPWNISRPLRDQIALTCMNTANDAINAMYEAKRNFGEASK